jgi:hypothetical protein
MSRSRHKVNRWVCEKYINLEKTAIKYRLRIPLEKVIAEYDATMDVIERYDEVVAKIDAA